VHPLVKIKDFDNIKMHGTTKKKSFNYHSLHVSPVNLSEGTNIMYNRIQLPTLINTLPTIITCLTSRYYRMAQKLLGIRDNRLTEI
jgi:hypothetical protein